MQTIENGSEILASIAGALGVTDGVLKPPSYVEKFDKPKAKKYYNELAKDCKSIVKQVKGMHSKMMEVAYDCQDIDNAVPNCDKYITAAAKSIAKFSDLVHRAGLEAADKAAKYK